MTAPQRLRLLRTKGFDLQRTSLAINGLPAVKVDRSTPYGNPFRVGGNMSVEDAVECFREFMVAQGQPLTHIAPPYRTYGVRTWRVGANTLRQASPTSATRRFSSNWRTSPSPPPKGAPADDRPSTTHLPH